MKQDDVSRLIVDMKQRFAKIIPESKYQFSRNWYVADFNYKNYDEVREWCVHHFGKEDKFPNAWSRWQHRYELQIFFRDEKDYVLFMLRWS